MLLKFARRLDALQILQGGTWHSARISIDTKVSATPVQEFEAIRSGACHTYPLPCLQ
jgi:hypothetical protein